MTPLIGVTTGYRTVRSGEGETRAHSLFTDYTAMVRRAGGMPVALVPIDDPAEIVDRLDGLVMTGGGDVEPSRYGGTTHESVYGVEPERDEFEITLARTAHEQGLPTLLICRGMQVMNVALGGTLFEDIPSGVEGAIEHLHKDEAARTGVHEVRLADGSRLADLWDTTAVNANSIHHQAIRQLGTGLRATGTTSDGVIEAVEHTDDAWPMWAVQWHPEWLPDQPESAALFGALVDAARSAAVAR